MATTLIVSGIKVEGKITGKADVKVEGEVVGEINLESSIYISDQGKTEASITADNVFIAGTHTGNVMARELIQLSATAVVKGEIKAPYISIEKGAKFTGAIETLDAAEAGSVSAPAEKALEELTTPEAKPEVKAEKEEPKAETVENNDTEVKEAEKAEDKQEEPKEETAKKKETLMTDYIAA